MTSPEHQDDAEISLFAVGTALLRNRWRIARWMALGAVVAWLSVYSKPELYTASASFIPEGYGAGQSGAASIAGRLGVTLPTTNQSLSPEFYSKLLMARVLLVPIATDTFVVEELEGRRVPFAELFSIEEGTAAGREEAAVATLRGVVSGSVDKTTGVVELAVTTKWRSVSLAITTAILEGLNEYNQRTRQGQAAAERRFVEGRLSIARADLREAEDRLERFLMTNRQFGGSPELVFERDRLQRDVTLRQEVFTSLTKAYEDVRIREVRDTPVITLFEEPFAPAAPAPRGRAKMVALGLILGGVIGASLALASGMIARRRREGGADVDEFVGTVGELRGELRGRGRWLRERIGR